MIPESGQLDIKTYMSEKRQRIEEALETCLPPEETYPQTLHRAMRYSVFSGGKRFRPILCMTSFEVCGGSGEAILPVACAVEMIHTYSLIHDDLPCMDDDDLRRGKPTSHKVFGEAVAVLAGDALLGLAIETVARRLPKYAGYETTTRVLVDLLAAIGTDGMVAGQLVDIESEGKPVDATTVEYIHSRKTGCLIASSVRVGAIVAGASDSEIERLSTYGSKIGLAFQIVDDILDVVGSFGDLKSGAGLDAERQKATYPGVLGVERSKAIAESLIAEAKDCLEDLGPRALPLRLLADMVVRRKS